MTNPPLKLNMGFGEALRRFVQTKPEEMEISDTGTPSDEWVTIAHGKFTHSPEDQAIIDKLPMTEVEMAILKRKADL